MAAAVENSPKALSQWMAANRIPGALAPKFLQAVEKKVAKSTKMIPVEVLLAPRTSIS
jgi:hypothetical protein